MTTPDHAQLLDAAATMLRSAGLTADDLADHLEGSTAGYPTLAEHIVAVEAAVKSQATMRTWRTHWRRLRDGVAPQCACLCDQCLDTNAGCACDCRTCGTKLDIPAGSDRVLRPGTYRKSDLAGYVTVAERLSAKKATRDNKGRARRGLAPKSTHGKGGGENAVTAWRHLFQVLVDDELWPTNPAMLVAKPTRDDTPRRSVRDHELPELFKVVVGGGDDPELDFLLMWFHLETGARRAGALALRVGDIHEATQMIRLSEKNRKVADQPASPELIDMLRGHSITRGGPACNPADAAFDPTRPVFYFVDSDPVGRTHALTSKRYDTLHERLQKELPWAKATFFSVHAMRKTGASIIERISGSSETARLWLRHGRRNETHIYTESWEQRLAEAFSVFTGSPHPAATPQTSDESNS